MAPASPGHIRTSTSNQGGRGHPQQYQLLLQAMRATDRVVQDVQTTVETPSSPPHFRLLSDQSSTCAPGPTEQEWMEGRSPLRASQWAQGLYLPHQAGIQEGRLTREDPECVETSRKIISACNIDFCSPGLSRCWLCREATVILNHTPFKAGPFRQEEGVPVSLTTKDTSEQGKGSYQARLTTGKAGVGSQDTPFLGPRGGARHPGVAGTHFCCPLSSRAFSTPEDTGSGSAPLYIKPVKAEEALSRRRHQAAMMNQAAELRTQAARDFVKQNETPRRRLPSRP